MRRNLDGNATSPWANIRAAFPQAPGNGTREKFLRYGEMTDCGEGPYFASRELSERALSRDASDPRAAEAHAELADRYEALAAVFGAKRLASIPHDYF